MRKTFSEFWSWTWGLHDSFLMARGFPAQRIISKAGPAGCWLEHKDHFLRSDVHTAVKDTASAETILISNTQFHVAIIYVYQTNTWVFCSESLVSVEVSQEPGRKQSVLRDTKLG